MPETLNLTPALAAKELASTISMLKGAEEVGAFLGDLLSPRELSNCASRWYIIRCLADGLSYREVQERVHVNDTRVGGATILRAKRALADSKGGFRMALERTAKLVRAAERRGLSGS